MQFRRIHLLASSRFFRKMLLSYVISSGTVFLVLSILLTSLVSRYYLDSLNTATENTLLQSVSTSNNIFSNMYNYYFLDVLEDPNLIYLLSAPSFDANVSIACSKISKRILNYNSLVMSFYLINYKGGFVCSNYDTYKSMGEFYDQSIFKVIEEQSFSNETILFPREIEYELHAKTHHRKYLSLIFRKFKDAILVINLDHNLLSQMITTATSVPMSRTLLLNKQGYVLADSHGELFGENYTDAPLYHAVSTSESSSFLYDDDMGKRFVSYRPSEVLQLSFIATTDYSAFSTHNPLLLGTIASITLAMCISLLVSFLISYFLYRPIQSLKERLGIEDTQNNIDEFDYFAESFANIKAGYQEARKESELLYRQTRNQKLLDLLHGKETELNSFLSDFEHLDIQFKERHFIVLTVDLRNYEEIIVREGMDIRQIKSAIGSILLYATELEVALETVDFSDHLAFILNMSDQVCERLLNSNMSLVKAAFHTTRDMMLEHFDVELSCSVGVPVKSLLDCSESYECARIASRYQIYCQDHGVIYYGDLNQNEGVDQSFPYDEDRMIIASIHNNDTNSLKNHLASFFQVIHGYSYNEVIYSLVSLLASIERYANKHKLLNNDSPLNFQTIQKENLFQLEEMFYAHCTAYIRLRGEISANDESRKIIVRRVLDFIDQNIGNAGLSMDMISDNIGLSPSYLRVILKESTGNTISNIIIQKRIKNICSLLVDTNFSIQRIADKMGFTTKNYIYTFFKNYVGMTPTEYRRRNRKPSGK